MTDEEMCPDCYGDPDTVCDACGQHSCWEGEFMCHEALSAGTTTRAIWAEKIRLEREVTS